MNANKMTVILESGGVETRGSTNQAPELWGPREGQNKNKARKQYYCLL